MAIVVAILSAVFLALGAVPPLAGAMAAARLQARLGAPAAVTVAAVPTWRLLAGDVDRLQLSVGPTTLAEVPIGGLTVQGGPCRLDAPCRLQAELQVAVRDLEPTIRTTLQRYTDGLAETLGVPGAQVADLAVVVAERCTVSGRLEAFGGLVAVPFRIEGRLGRLDDQTVGLLDARATVQALVHALGDVPVWTLPAPPVAGLQMALQRLDVAGGQVQARLQLDVARPRTLLESPPTP